MSGYGPQWRQLQQSQPNVSGLMSEVRGGINDAASAAEGILGQYQKGAELKAENELIRRIGGMDQDQLRTAFNSGAFDDLNLGENGLRTLNEAMGARADIRSTNVNSDRTQASIGWGNDANSRANAAEGRSATRFGWEDEDRADQLARRDWKRDNAYLFIEGEQNAFTQGLAPSSLVRTESGGNFAARNDSQGAGGQGHFGRVQFGRARFKEAKAAGAVPPGMTIEQFGQDTPESRQAQIDAERWHFGDIQNRISDTGLEKYIGQTIGGVEITRDGMVAMAHLGGFGGMRQFLESGGQYNPADDNGTSLSDYARTHAGNTSGPRQGNSGFQPAMPNRGGDAYAEAMAGSGLFTGQESLNAINPMRSAAITGQAEIDRQRAAYTADVVTGITQNVVSSDGFIPGDTASVQTAIQEQLVKMGDYSTSEAADLAAAAVKQIESDAALNYEFNRGRSTEAQNAVINEALTNGITQANRGLTGNDQFRAVQDIERYRQAEQPHLQLESDLAIPEDAQTLGNYRPEMLRRLVNYYASEFGVEPAVVAVAMRDVYNSDPGDDPYSSFWYDSDMTLNTLENRFDKAAVEAAVQQLTPELMAEYDRAKSELTINETRLQQNASQQRQILGQMNRFEASVITGDPGNTDDPRYQTLRKRLDRLIKEAATISRDTGNLDGR